MQSVSAMAISQDPEPAAPGGLSFEIRKKSVHSRARLGRLVTPHGAIDTPNYIFCGTKGAIKGLSPEQVRAAGADIILGNTYHLMLQPGPDLIAEMGGLQEFSGWRGPMLTDSGGFQVFSMGDGAGANEIKGRNRDRNRTRSVTEITEQGVRFKSYLDGRFVSLTPENAMEIQRKIGADLIMQFDECTAYHVSRDYTEGAMRRSHRWGDRCLTEFARTDSGRQGLYGIVQGGVYPELRAESSAWTRDRPFFGTAIGGCLGNSQGGDEAGMSDVVGWCVPHIHPDRPVHLLGVGRIADIFRFVRMGIDTFDCVSPTRIARHGMALVRGADADRINLYNARYRNDSAPLDETSDFGPSRDFSRAYIHHLLKAGEMLGIQILTAHNINIMTSLMREVRAAIAQDTLDDLEKQWMERSRG